MRHPVLVFFGLTFLLSGTAAIPLILSLQGLVAWKVPGVLGLVAAVGPGAAAVLTAALEGRRRGATTLLRAAIQWRVGLRWYLGVLAFAPVALAVTFAIHAALGGTFPHLTDRFPEFPALLLFLTVQTGLGEELGWRGFAQRRLEPTRGVVGAALLIGLVWSVWHTALFLIPHSMQWQMAQLVGWLPAVGGYGVYLLLTAVLYALVLDTSGSLLMPVLLHGTTNATAWLFTLNEVEHHGVRPMILFTALQAGLVVVWVTRRRRSRATGRRGHPPQCDRNSCGPGASNASGSILGGGGVKGA